MKVLFIGNYRNYSGWGDAAYNKILSMYSAGIDLYLNNLDFNQGYRQCQLLDELERKKTNKFDYIIQYTLPELYHYESNGKVIGNYECEATFTTSGWHKHINMLDEAWVSCEESAFQSRVSGVDKPIHIIPNAVNLEAIRTNPIAAEIGELQGGYNFLFVGELTKRKNVRALLEAFHLEFHPDENVNLFLKLNKTGHSSSDTYNVFQSLNENVKNSLRIRKHYKEVICKTDYVPTQHLWAMMQNCHCFVCPSFGEGWCIPAIESQAMGLQMVYNEKTAVRDYAHKQQVSFAAYKSPCIGVVDGKENLYNAYEYWSDFKIENLMQSMRYAYETRNTFNKEAVIEHTKQWSIENVGQKIKEQLENA